jgi:hypothetical protein
MQPLRIATRNLMAGDAVYRPISRAARNFASSHTWPCVFQQLYETYEVGLQRISAATRQAAAQKRSAGGQ